MRLFTDNYYLFVFDIEDVKKKQHSYLLNVLRLVYAWVERQQDHIPPSRNENNQCNFWKAVPLSGMTQVSENSHFLVRSEYGVSVLKPKRFLQFH